MNQIICTSSSNLEISNKNYQKKNLFRILFYVFVFMSISFSIYYIYFRYDIYISERISQKILDNLNITFLYNNTSDYTANLINQEILLDNSKNISVSAIGIIEIKKINIVYPILSELNKDFLKISPCRFYGPNPNSVGNLCIAAHNYKNESFFSNISNLVNGDIITIYDVYGNSIDYVVYNNYTSSANDTECMSQNTNNSKIVTLVTCDSRDNKYRTIVKAKEL